MTAIMTKENVSEFVQLYFELHQPPYITTFKEKCQQMYERQGGGTDKMKMSDIYHICWAIRLLAEPGKYDFDDIEFHVRKNPFFAEIATDDEAADDMANKPKQVGLLRQAIRDYRTILAGQLKMAPLNAKL